MLVDFFVWLTCLYFPLMHKGLFGIVQGGEMEMELHFQVAFAA